MTKTLIAIPVYNAEDCITRTLNSCINQTIKTEIFVVDNCSTDGTQKIVKSFVDKYENVKLFINERNVGRVGNWNRCLDLFEKSIFCYMRFVFSGDEILSHCTERVEKIFEDNAGLSAVIADYLNKGSGRTDIIGKKLPESGRYSKEVLVEKGYSPGNITSGPCCTYAKESVSGNRYDELFFGCITFNDKVIPMGDVYYLKEVLSVLNIDGRKSQHKMQHHLYWFERPFARLMGLEGNKEWLRDNMYKKLKEDIMFESLQVQLRFFSVLSLQKLMRVIACEFWKRCMKKVYSLPGIKRLVCEGINTNICIRKGVFKNERKHNEPIIKR